MKTFDMKYLNADNAEVLLKNPDRGFRMETYITLGDPVDSYPTSNEDPFERILKLIEKYKEDSPTLCQVYVYLSNYNDKPLDELAFSQMKRFLKFSAITVFVCFFAMLTAQRALRMHLMR